MKTRLLILLAPFLFLTACSYIYVPNAHNVPLIGQRGELQAAVLTGTTRFDVHTAYGLTDNVAIMANGSFSNRYRDRLLDSSQYHVHNVGEVAAGYFNKIGKSGRVEVYGGLGYGETSDYGEFGVFNSDVYRLGQGSYGKFFIQPNVGSVSDVFDGAMSLRICYVKYFDFHYYDSDYNSNSSIFIEPVMTGKIGYKYVKFIVQAGLSLPVLQSEPVFFNPLILNVGLNFKIDTRKTKPLVK